MVPIVRKSNEFDSVTEKLKRMERFRLHNLAMFLDVPYTRTCLLHY